MQVVKSSDVTDPSSFYKITACRRCGKVKIVARESGVCEKCGYKIVNALFESITGWR